MNHRREQIIWLKHSCFALIGYEKLSELTDGFRDGIYLNDLAIMQAAESMRIFD